MASVSYCIYGPLAHESHECRDLKKKINSAEDGVPVRLPGQWEHLCLA